MSSAPEHPSLTTQELVATIRDRIWSECDPCAIIGAGSVDAPRIVAALAAGFLDEVGAANRSVHAESVVAGVVAATLGLGPLQPLLADPDISEIMVNGPASVFIERNGVVERCEVTFDDDSHVLRVIDRILAPIGRRIDASAPMVDARLLDGSRVNAVVAPLAVDGPLLTIRRFLRIASTIDDLVRIGSVQATVALELERLVRARANVLVSGGTGTGKTTLLAAVLASSARDDRIVVIEDSAELPLEHPHRIRLEARPESADGSGGVSVRDLVRNSLRMRPDRIVVGEVRGGEAFDLLQALNTGHRGSWSTIHANGVHDALLRLETMVLCADSGMPHSAVRAQVGRAVDAVVQLERCADGRRRVADIATVERDAVSDAWTVRSILMEDRGEES